MTGLRCVGEEAAPPYSQDAGPCGSLEGSAVHLLQMYIFFQFPAWKDSFTPTSIALYVYTCSHEAVCSVLGQRGKRGVDKLTEDEPPRRNCDIATVRAWLHLLFVLCCHLVESFVL